LTLAAAAGFVRLAHSVDSDWALATAAQTNNGTILIACRDLAVILSAHFQLCNAAAVLWDGDVPMVFLRQPDIIVQEARNRS
jgi:hypothetical protein